MPGYYYYILLASELVPQYSSLSRIEASYYLFQLTHFMS